MSVVFDTGLPGNGKTLFLVNEIIRKLVETDRFVVTTCTEIKVARLQEYIFERYPNFPGNVTQRLHFIEKADTTEFYRYRGKLTLPPFVPLPRTASEKEKDAAHAAYFAQITDPRGVDYYLTEAHRHFKADTWSDMSDLIMFYFTQHRHLDDNVMIETQLAKQVVIQLRDLADECIYIQNHYRQRFGWFQKPGCFYVRRYYSVPKTLGAGEPYATGKFYLDVKGVASCYNTRGAVVEGTGGTEQEVRKKGLPLWSLFAASAAAVVLVCAAIWYIPKLAVLGLGKLVGHMSDTAQTALKDGLHLEPNAPLTTRPNEGKPAAVPAVAGDRLVGSPTGRPPGRDDHEKGLFVTGMLWKGGEFIIIMSDGTRRSNSSKVPLLVQYHGESYWFAQNTLSPAGAVKSPARPFRRP